MLVLRQDSVVGLELVLLEEALAIGDLHVEQGVAHRKELVGHVLDTVVRGRQRVSGSQGLREENHTPASSID